ncbi:M23 family peptidase [filamentous cyanobacterium CCP5]|nr:M23 family peptidase [filamentous cyanobacterium CCP5]
MRERRFAAGSVNRWGLALRWIVVLGVWVWGMAEFSRNLEEVRAEPEVANVIEQQPDPWAGASFPLENFSRYTSPFGYRQHPYGGRRFHYGLDLAAPMGSYIRSWWDGTALRVAEDNACGTHIIVKSDRWTHVYCHMQGHVVIEKDGDRVLVDEGGQIHIVQGQNIKAGTPIGRVGMTGSTTGPHLHWGLKYEGTWVDPALVLKAMYARQTAKK